MLRQRIITAVILLVVVLAALLAPHSWPMLLLLSALSALALWEWLRLTLPVRWSAVAVGGSAASFVIACILLFTPGGKLLLVHLALMGAVPFFGLVSLFWLLVGLPSVVRGNAETSPESVFFSLVAVAVTSATWLSLVLLFLHRGPWFLVSLLALIWVADIGAYFAGKTFGRRKLAPRVSPGKTWEGALGGIVLATVWVFASSAWAGSFGHALSLQWSWPVTAMMAAGLAALSILGDLFESLLKRRAGRKDSSGLLPGHGGVFDRVDALLPVAPLAFLLTGI